jgi:Flavodoxin
MEVVIVYESLFGNTRSIAEDIAEGFSAASPDAHVVVLDVQEAPPDKVCHADLLVVGGPTHVFRMTTGRTRRMSMRSSGEEPVDERDAHLADDNATLQGVREWLRALPAAPSGSQAAGFDTRLASPVAGCAAPSISRRLRHHGYEVVSGPKGFIVSGARGPLKSGEDSRARLWGVKLARSCSSKK